MKSGLTLLSDSQPKNKRRRLSKAATIIIILSRSGSYHRYSIRKGLR